MITYLASSPNAYQGAGGRTRIISVAILHQKLGYQTHVVCLVQLSHYLKPGYLRQAKKELAKEANCSVTYIPTIPTFKQKKLIWLRDALSVFVLKLLFRFNTPNIIHSHGQSAAYLATLATKSLKDVFLTADIHGASPEEAAYARGVDFEHPAIKKLSNREKVIYEKSDLCVFVSNRMVQHVEDKFGFVPENKLIVPCASSTLKKSQSNSDIRKELGIENKLAFVYLGSFRKYQMAEETIDLFKQIKEHIDRCVLVIFTSHVNEFDQAAKKANLTSKDYITKTLKRKEVPTYLAAMDIGFMLRQNELLNIVASPTKFAEYLISGVPVITTPYVGDYSAMVSSHKLGFVSEDLTYSKSLSQFISDVKAQRENYRVECIRYSTQQLTWDAVENDYKMALPK